MRMKKTSRKHLRSLRRRRLALALVGAMAMPLMPALAQSLPSTGGVVNGTASIGQSGTQMTITQTSKGAIIDWGSFDIGTGYGVTFDQQFGASSVTLNRVIGFGYSTSASQINGTLTSNGSVFLINPAGITFGSGAVVNVGGLVASTLDMSDADFLSGLSSGKYIFTASSGNAGAIVNSGQLTAADGGTIGLIGSYIGNSGTISANLGSVVFGATSQVTLDFFGDGLTQVTVSGNGLGVSNCSLDCNGGINSSGNVFAPGGHIEMRSNTMDGQSAGNALFVDPANGGRIWISGNVAAQTSGTRRGSVIIDAGMGNIDLGGVQGLTANVSANAINAGEQAGTVQLRGNQLFTHLCVWTNGACENNNQLGFINATTYGDGGLAGGTIDIDVGRLYHAGVIQASSATGAGGTVNINAGSAEIYSLVFAEGYGGPGGSINITANSLLLHRGETPWLGGPGLNYSLATLSAFGSTSGGTVNLDAGSLSMVDLGNVSPDDVNLDPIYRPTINVNGYGGDGGSINVTTSNFTLSPWQYFEATGTGAGGDIDIVANSINLAGGLVATGGTSWGTVSTSATGSLFAAPSAYIQAGTWQIHAPSVQIVPAAGAQPGSGAVLTDAALSSTLDGGTSIQVLADAALASGATGIIHIGQGVNIVHATSNEAALDLRATAGIYGSDFDIQSTGGPLDLSFTANVNGDNPDGGFVSLFNIDLASNGGDIDMHADGRGVYLEYSQLSSGDGNITIFGNGNDNGVLLVQTGLTSTGGDISIEASSVYGAAARLDAVDISSGGGDITIDGNGPDGISVVYSILASAGGDIAIDGQGIYSGSYFHASIADSADGDITITGTASLEQTGYYPFGVALAGSTLTSTAGDISVVGDALGGSGIEFWTSGSMTTAITTTSGAISLTSTGASGLGLEGLDIATDTGDITITGSASDATATAGVFVGSSGLHSNGGDISITGNTAGGTGVWLYYGDLSSSGGDITITGDGFLYGVQVWGGLVSSGTGDILLTGTASGSDSTGVNVRDGSFASTSGSITIDGSAALGTGVFFGSTTYGPGSSVTTTSGAIDVTSIGLYGLNVADIPFSTDSGDIILQGTATGGDAGVFVGSGGLHTNGGDITIIGSSAYGTGVLIDNGASIASSGGDIGITGTGYSADYGQGLGVLLQGDIASDGGDIAIEGHALGSDGGSGVYIGSSQVNSNGGDIAITGSTSGTVHGWGGVDVRGALASGGGTIILHGSALAGPGVYLGPDAEATSGGGDIVLEGDGLKGVWLHGGTVASSGGDVAIVGSGTDDAGLRVDAASAIDAGAGLLTLRAGNNGASDAIVLQGDIAATSGVVLTPYDASDTILLGAGNGFSLTHAELAMIDTPLLVIGSAQHAGAIRVTEAVDWDGDLTLQNQGGSGGIDLQAAVDVGDHTLALASGGDIGQAAAGAITAHSLLAIAEGDVSLVAADNNVAASSVAGSAGGDFAYEDMDDLAIGEVSSQGYGLNASVPGLVGLSASGITAEGDVLVRTATGDLILGADVSGTGVDLVAAETFQNPGSAVVSASDGWRIWARTWEGEDRGGLAGDAPFDVFGCAFGGNCTGIGAGNQFIYQERRLTQSPLAPQSVVEWIEDDKWTTGAQDVLQAAICPVGDFAGDPLGQGAGSDELARQWLKSRHRLRLNNCIDSNGAPGCRF